MSGFRIAMLSVHTCPLATLGGKETGGMNVYVRDLSRELARRGHRVDVYTRSQDPDIPRIGRGLGRGARVIHLPAGPEHPYDKRVVHDHLPEFVDGVLAQAEVDGIAYDLIHSHYWLSGCLARNLKAAWGGIPVVQMFHTLGLMKNRVARFARLSVMANLPNDAWAIIENYCERKSATPHRSLNSGTRIGSLAK